MKNNPTGKRRLLHISLYVLLAAVTTAAITQAPKQYSDYLFNHARKIKGTFISPDYPDQGIYTFAPGEAVSTFYALGDTGTGSSGQYQVGKAMNELAAVDKPSCVLMLGDNFYNYGVKSVDDPQWETKFEKPYGGRNLKIPFYACLGNHDHRGNIDAQIDKSRSNARWRMPARNFHIAPDSAHPDLVEVFAVDTDPIENRSIGYKENITIIGELLKNSTARWKIVMGHHPLQSGGRPQHYGDSIKSELLQTLTENGADFYICGHNHIMEMGTVDGRIPYAVLGSGGHVKPKIIEIPNMFFASATLGFGKIQVSQDRILMNFIDHNGKNVYTRAILKQPQ